MFRAVFIAPGSALPQYEWVVWVFGGLLIVTGMKMMFAPDKEIAPGNNPLLRVFRRFIPIKGSLHARYLYSGNNAGIATTATGTDLFGGARQGQPGMRFRF